MAADCTCPVPPEFLVPPPPKPPFMPTECEEIKGHFHVEDQCENYIHAQESYFHTAWSPLMPLSLSFASFLLLGCCVVLVCKRWRKPARNPVERNSVFFNYETQTRMVDNDLVQVKGIKSGDPKLDILAVAPEPPLFICYASEELFHPEYQVLPFNTAYEIENYFLCRTSVSEEEY